MARKMHEGASRFGVIEPGRRSVGRAGCILWIVGVACGVAGFAPGLGVAASLVPSETICQFGCTIEDLTLSDDRVLNQDQPKFLIFPDQDFIGDFNVMPDLFPGLSAPGQGTGAPDPLDGSGGDADAPPRY